MVEELSELIQEMGGAGLVAVTDNLVDQVWGGERPATPGHTIFIQPEQYAGKSVRDKLSELQELISKKKVHGILVTMLDQIAWLLNLRGSDVKYNPLFYGYLSITASKAILYVDESKIDKSVGKYLSENGIYTKPYDSFYGDVNPAAGEKYIISKRASWAVRRAIGADRAVELEAIAEAKAIKNEVELNGARACHIRDGAALTSFFAWLEHQLIKKKATITEAEAADKLFALRQKQDLFVGNSFETISCTGKK